MPGRDRSVRDIGYHLLKVCLAHRIAMEQGKFPEGWLLEGVPPDVVNGADVAGYAHEVRDRLKEWCSRPDVYSGSVKVYPSGSQTAQDLLERTAWHAAQHLRQLYALLESMGETPVNPLTDEDFVGLPLPKEIWS